MRVLLASAAALLLFVPISLADLGWNPEQTTSYGWAPEDQPGQPDRNGWNSYPNPLGHSHGWGPVPTPRPQSSSVVPKPQSSAAAQPQSSAAPKPQPSAVPTQVANPSVNSTSGLIIGHRALNRTSTYEFLGIKYGQAPVDTLRFAPPKRYVAPAGTVYNASNWVKSYPTSSLHMHS